MNEMILQRLIDGELSHRERSDFLRSLGDNAHHWQTIAMHLLEDREFAKALRSTDFADAIPSATPGAFNQDKRLSRSRTRLLMTALAVAASLLLLTSGALIGKRFQLEQSPVVESSTARLSGIAPQTAAVATETHSSLYSGMGDLIEAGTLKFVSLQGESAALETPIYEVESLQPEMIFGYDQQQLETLQKQFQQSGWSLGIDTDVYGAELPDGRQMIIPIRNVRFEPYGI